MIKQSKTTIKELSAQYRSVLKKAFFAGVIALTTSVANAETNVDFSGHYTNTSGANVSVNDAVANVTYHYTKTDNSDSGLLPQSTDPDLTDFTYTAPDDTVADLSSATPAQTDYTDTSTADNTTVRATSTTLVSGTTPVAGNYEYMGGDGQWIQYGNAERDMTETVVLETGSNNYTSGQSIDVINGTASGTFDGTAYNVTINGDVYHLSADGTKLVDIHDVEVTPTSGSQLETDFNNMKTEYTAAAERIADAETNTLAQHNTEHANYLAAGTVLTNDITAVNALNTKYNTLTDAQTALQVAQANQAAAQATYAANQTDLTDAQAVYNAPILTTIDNRVGTAATTAANNAIDTSIASGSIKTALDAKADATDLAGKADTTTVNAALAGKQDSLTTTQLAAVDSGITATDVAAIATNTAAIAAHDTAIAANTTAIANEETARQNADAALQTAINNINTATTAAVDALDTRIAANTNAITGLDNKVEKLDKDLSAGIAGVAALSSVEVSNVKKGEMSVGGGYGYFNGESAVALGAAMGITDNWSVNAGASVSGNQTAFRAGTHYKFKLF